MPQDSLTLRSPKHTVHGKATLRSGSSQGEGSVGKGASKPAAWFIPLTWQKERTDSSCSLATTSYDVHTSHHMYMCNKYEKNYFSRVWEANHSKNKQQKYEAPSLHCVETMNMSI